MIDLTKTIQALRTQMRTWWADKSLRDAKGVTQIRAWCSDFNRPETFAVTDLPADAVLKALALAINNMGCYCEELAIHGSSGPCSKCQAKVEIAQLLADGSA